MFRGCARALTGTTAARQLPRAARMNKGPAMFSSSTVFRPLAATATLLALAGAGAAQAQDEENPSGPYISAGIGQFDVKLDSLEGVDDVLEDLDSDDSAWKVGFGWRFNPY